MKKIILVLNIAILTLSGMTQNQQEKERITQQRHSLSKEHKPTSKLNTPKIQKAIKMRLDSMISEDWRILLTDVTHV
jgi:hypothetical protein